jgi:hypothetical protein
MARQNVPFRENDVRRAVAGVVKAGVQIGRVELTRDGGKIVIYPKGDETKPEGEPKGVELQL